MRKEVREFSDAGACEIPKGLRSFSVRKFRGFFDALPEHMRKEVIEFSDAGAREIPKGLRSLSVWDFPGNFDASQKA